MIATVLYLSPHSTAYGWLMLLGIFVSIFLWSQLVRRDDRLVLVYVAALVGAFLGAKVVYLAAEGWLHWHDPNRWVILATGKSITGALLGGYLAVEIAKVFVNYRGTTGDWFAVIVPTGVMIGRVGCIINGCCLGKVWPASWYTVNDVHGVPRWPAPEMELLFNAIMLGIILVLRRKQIAQGQLFHIYLMAYGIFRFFHEFLRDTPQIIGPISGYQVAALAIFILGLVGFMRRRHQTQVYINFSKATNV